MTHEVNLILLDILAQVPNFRKDQAKNVFGFSLGIHQKNQERIESVPISSVPKQTLADRAVAEDRLDQQRAIDDAQLKCTLDSVDTLPKRERDALRLQLEGLEYKQIADQLGVSVAVVRNLLYRARKKLEAQVAEALGSDEDLKD